ncbi:MAG: hypothetical protein J1E16_04415 [Muribaculaceae bacterium]|nr:hypothetical protein [Muribaculaceae bacterium]
MINGEELKNIEEIVNKATPCKWCGKSHSVRLFINLDGCLHPIPMTKIFPSGEMLFMEFDEFSCDTFKENVKSFIDSQKYKLLIPNIF